MISGLIYIAIFYNMKSVIIHFYLKRWGGFRIHIGIKKLLALIDTVKQIKSEQRVVKFLCKLEEEGGLEQAYDR